MTAEKKTRWGFIRNLGPLLGLLILCVVLTGMSDRFLTMDNLLNVTRQVSINAVISVGMTLVILTGGIDLSVGSILAFAGSITAGLLSGGQSLVPAIIVGVVAGAFIGMINGALMTRAGIPPFIATLGTMTAARGFTLVYTDGRPITGMEEAFRFLGGGYIAGIPVPVIIMAVIFLLAHIMLTRTKFGRYVYAIGGNEEAARLSGIGTKKILLSVYTLAGLLAGFSGVIMASRLNSAQPTAGIPLQQSAISRANAALNHRSDAALKTRITFGIIEDHPQLSSTARVRCPMLVNAVAQLSDSDSLADALRHFALMFAFLWCFLVRKRRLFVGTGQPAKLHELRQ